MNEIITISENIFKIHQVESEKLPYHFNLIDEIKADENAHSRILSKILEFKKKGENIFLEDFLKNVCNFNIDIKDLKIKKVDSCGRIDLPIHNENTFIVIENKINGADEQNKENGGQLARYIESIITNYNIDKENIYIVFTPRFNSDASDEIWINKNGDSYKDEFKTRYKCISYSEDIYTWINNFVKTNIDNNNIYFKSAITQYLDYLKGIFNLRNINKEMNNKIEKSIKLELGINNNLSINETLTILSQKELELETYTNHFKSLKFNYHRKKLIKLFTEWRLNLENDLEGFNNFKIEEEQFKSKINVINLGIVIEIEEKKYGIILECNDPINENIYVGICNHWASKNKHEMTDVVSSILVENELNFEKPDKLWYGWKYIQDESPYNSLVNLIKNIMNRK